MAGYLRQEGDGQASAAEGSGGTPFVFGVSLGGAEVGKQGSVLGQLVARSQVRRRTAKAAAWENEFTAIAITQPGAAAASVG